MKKKTAQGRNPGGFRIQELSLDETMILKTRRSSTNRVNRISRIALHDHYSDVAVLWRKTDWMLQRLDLPGNEHLFRLYIPTHLIPDEWFNFVPVTLHDLACPFSRLWPKLTKAGVIATFDDIVDLVEGYGHYFCFMKLMAVKVDQEAAE